MLNKKNKKVTEIVILMELEKRMKKCTAQSMKKMRVINSKVNLMT